METKRFVYYQEGEMWVGWLEEYPDYRTQGATLTELQENLKDVYDELTSGRIPCGHTVVQGKYFSMSRAPWNTPSTSTRSSLLTR
jgi:hypothetical protein